MPEIRTYWNGFDDKVFGPQPANPTVSGPNQTDTGQFPQCGKQQERNWALECLLYGMEYVITPILAQINTNLNKPSAIDSIYTQTDRQTLSGSSAAINTPPSVASYDVFKVSIQNPPTSANAVTIKQGANVLSLFPGISIDLFSTDPAGEISVNGDSGVVLQIIWTYQKQ